MRFIAGIRVGNKIDVMEINKWTTVDVHYDESELKGARKMEKYLTRLGYSFEQSTESGLEDYDLCDQYIKSGKRLYK